MEKIALVLPGAGSKGAYFEGILQAIEETHLPISKVYGTSIGALVGATYCKGWGVDQRMALWDEIAAQFDKLASPSVFRVTLFSFFDSWRDDKKLKRWIQDRFMGNIEQLSKPLAVSVTDARTADNLIIEKGSLSDAIIGSSALPPALSPWEMEVDGKNILAIDGGVTNNIMLENAIMDGYTNIILPVIGRVEMVEKFKGWLSLIMRAFKIKLDDEIEAEVDNVKQSYPNIKLTLIEPLQDFINDQNALKFDPAFVKRAIKQGHDDAVKAFAGVFA